MSHFDSFKNMLDASKITYSEHNSDGEIAIIVENSVNTITNMCKHAIGVAFYSEWHFDENGVLLCVTHWE